MAALAWINENWFNLFQTLILGGTLWIAIVALRGTTDALRIQNLFSITQQHRDIWSLPFEHRELWRVVDPAADVASQKPSREEERFVLFLIFHLYDSYSASEHGLYPAREHLKLDIREFFKLPIPRVAWQKFRKLQDPEFVRFVDAAIKGDKLS